MYRIHWKRVLLLSFLGGIAVLFLRGYFFARCSASIQKESSIQTDIVLYEHKNRETTLLALEEYLVGVVAAEMPASFAEEALKAQVVAARTYTLYKSAHGGCASCEGADICTNSACCQAYRTEEELLESWGEAYQDNLSKIRQAVKDTSGEILTYDGELVEALYHASSGGSTEDSEEVFRYAVPYLRAVESTNESGTGRLSAKVGVDRRNFCDKINQRYPEAGLSSQKLESQVEILDTSQSGRVRSMRLGGVTISGRDARKLLHLDSTLFTIEFTSAQILFFTKGYGHGVGMSQTGANGMALGGRSYREILTYYYTGVTVDTVEAYS